MAVEIERKFLVHKDECLTLVRGLTGIPIRQGYLAMRQFDDGVSVVRVRQKGDKGYMTVKGPSSNEGRVRTEFEYEIPLLDVESMLRQLCVPYVIEKTRYELPFCGLIWEIDVFEGQHQGLIVAEIELQSPEQMVQLPGWISTEVTGDLSYYNSALAGLNQTVGLCDNRSEHAGEHRR